MAEAKNNVAIGAGILGMTLGIIGSGLVYSSPNSRRIPDTDKVQQGYVNPSSLEVQLRDSDNNGEMETILKIGDDSYALRFGEDGKPKLSEYNVKPAEIQYQEEDVSFQYPQQRLPFELMEIKNRGARVEEDVVVRAEINELGLSGKPKFSGKLPALSDWLDSDGIKYQEK